MDTRDALQKLRARREQRRGSDDAGKNPLLQVLKGILAFVGPILIVYYGNYFMSRSTADEFARHFLAEVSEGRLDDIYKKDTDDAFKADEAADAFVSRMRWMTNTLGKFQSAELTHFDVKLIGGGAELKYDAKFSNQKSKLVFLLAREKLSKWRVVRLTINAGKL